MDFLETTHFWNNTLLSWSYFLLALIATIVLVRFISRLLIYIMRAIAQKSKTKIDDLLIEIIRAPMNLALNVMGFYLSFLLIQLPKSFETIINHTLDSILIFAIFWLFLSALDLLKNALGKVHQKINKKLSNEVLNFIFKALKVFVILLGGMTILQQWGINVSGFIASLGLGGLAFALAAKDTAANLFGSLVILSDKPFMIGDWIKTDDVEGIVEEIGIRSTKIRSFGQAQVTVPNANLANAAIINWSRMGKRRIKSILGLTYDTTKAQMEAILADIESYLKSHKGVDSENIYIHFTGFNQSSLDIMCYFFTKTTVWKEHLLLQEEIFLEFMHIVQEKHHASFAFPTRTIQLEHEAHSPEKTLLSTKNT